MKLTIADEDYYRRVDAAVQHAAGTGPEWNETFRSGLAINGLALADFGEGELLQQYRNLGLIHLAPVQAPEPLVGRPNAWPRSLIVEA